MIVLDDRKLEIVDNIFCYFKSNFRMMRNIFDILIKYIVLNSLFFPASEDSKIFDFFSQVVLKIYNDLIYLVTFFKNVFLGFLLIFFSKQFCFKDSFNSQYNRKNRYHSLSSRSKGTLFF